MRRNGVRGGWIEWRPPVDADAAADAPSLNNGSHAPGSPSSPTTLATSRSRLPGDTIAAAAVPPANSSTEGRESADRCPSTLLASSRKAGSVAREAAGMPAASSRMGSSRPTTARACALCQDRDIDAALDSATASADSDVAPLLLAPREEVGGLALDSATASADSDAPLLLAPWEEVGGSALACAAAASAAPLEVPAAAGTGSVTT